MATAAALAAQTAPPLTESRVRAFARQARTESRGDSTDLVLALDRRVRETWGEFESFPMSILRRDDLLVTLTGPYMAFRRSIVDMLRTRRSIDEAPWVDAAVLTVSPVRLEAPDISQVDLTRNGAIVPAAKNELRPMTFDNGAGARGVLSAGDVRYPMSAFAPGGTVILTLRPRSGEPFVYRFSDAELSSLK
ncbi:MAG TPA: hypothetical protein VJP86_15605 [Vicinamibacterales bacterium]|nr:hypothetical protein [Vicinamibacterales bacterium]